MNIRNTIMEVLKNNNINFGEHNLSQEIEYNIIYDILHQLHTYEISGEYNLSGTFRIDYTASRWDAEDHRPFSLTATNKLFVWHSHPFRTTNNVDFPSIEDIDVIRLNPQNIGMIITQSGMYFMCSIKEIINITSITSFYREMSDDASNCIEWDYESISKNFLNNKCESISQKFGLYIKFIKHELLTPSLILNTVLELYCKLPNIRTIQYIQKFIDYNLLNPTNLLIYKPVTNLITQPQNNEIQAQNNEIQPQNNEIQNQIQKLINIKIQDDTKYNELLNDVDIGILSNKISKYNELLNDVGVNNNIIINNDATKIKRKNKNATRRDSPGIFKN